MKQLFLLRHAKSSWDAAVSRDYDRPLNPRGNKAGKRMGVYMRAQRLAWDALIVSPAVRTRETVGRLEAGYETPLDPIFDERLYMASTTQLLNLLRGLDDAAQSVMLIGHNPGIQGLALTLTPSNDDAARARLDAKFPTAGLTEISLPAKTWADITPASGTLVRFIKPKDLNSKEKD